VVLDGELVAHREASAFLRWLQGAGRSPHTIRAYAGRVALFLGWCAAQGVDWRRIELAELARFKHWVEGAPTRAGRARSGSTVNAILTAVCELLRFCARTGLTDARASRPVPLSDWSPGRFCVDLRQLRSDEFRSVQQSTLSTARHAVERVVQMAIDHVLAVVPVADIETACGWYERLLGREADNRPIMDSLAEWRVTDTGWVQVHHDADRAGTALLNFAVDDLTAHLDGLQARGLTPGAIQTVNKGVQLSAITDPEGNTITFIGSFRTDY
jgi:predicted enzyme related to lactoylglutathione lyase